MRLRQRAPATLAGVFVGGILAVGAHVSSAGASGGPRSFPAPVWTSATPPLPSKLPDGAGATSNLLGAASCWAIGACVSAGSTSDGSDEYSVVETLAAGKWTPTVLPAPTDARNGYTGQLRGVSCADSSFCGAVGTFDTTAGYQDGLLEILSGGTWSAVAAPLAAGVGTGGVTTLYAVSCAAQGSCVAVGDYFSSTDYGVIYTYSGGSWAAAVSPVPAGATSNTKLYSVSCPSATSCVVGGGASINEDSDDMGMVVRLKNGKWSANAAPLPSDAATPGSGDVVGGQAIQGMDCTRVGACTGAGSYLGTSGFIEGDVIALAGGTWSAAQVPATASQVGGGQPFVQATSMGCDSSDYCVAAMVDGSANGQHGAILDGSGGAWQFDPSTPFPGTTNPQAAGASCSPQGFCVVTENDFPQTGSGTLETTSLPGTYPVPTVSKVSPDTGPQTGGVTVAISGTGFYTGAAVQFGANAASGVVVKSSTRITATLPAGNGDVNVTVSTPGGTSKTSSNDLFQYRPAPKVGTLQPSSGTKGGGTCVTITGSALYDVSAVRFGSTTSGFVVDSATKIIALSPAHVAGSVSVTVVAAGGRSLPTASSKYTYTG